MKRSSYAMSTFGLVAALALSLATSCGQVTYIVQQYDGPVRDRDQVSILRLSPGDPAQVIAMDGEALGRQDLDSDVRLHIEMLPGKHQLEIENPQARAKTTQRVQFIAEPGRTYRVVLADRVWHAQKAEPAPAGAWSPLVYELDGSSDDLVREVSLPPSGT
ncbi:MAG TPA: hypothetical protein VI197_24210 [Polyangiaceae bacterium]